MMQSLVEGNPNNYHETKKIRKTIKVAYAVKHVIMFSNRKFSERLGNVRHAASTTVPKHKCAEFSKFSSYNWDF